MKSLNWSSLGKYMKIPMEKLAVSLDNVCPPPPPRNGTVHPGWPSLNALKADALHHKLMHRRGVDINAEKR